MRFPAYQIEVTADKRLKVTHQFIDETELIYDDPESRAFINASQLFSKEELSDSIIMEPDPMYVGENIHIHGRLVVDALCRSYLQIHPNVENRDAIKQVAKRQWSSETELAEEPDISDLASGEACTLSSWEDVEKFICWIKHHSLY